MKIIDIIKLYEEQKIIYDSGLLKFIGVDGYDVYNTSIPFTCGGRSFIFGRVEKREEWARSWVRLFEQTDSDQWSIVPESHVYPLEDPTVTVINNSLLLNGTHVQYRRGQLDRFYSYFYRGKNPGDLYHFATGPDNMKDIRLVELEDGRIGLFSRPRSQEIIDQYGSASMIGFAVVDHLDELDAQVIENASYIPDLFGEQEWGGCNQCYKLDNSLIGVIAHKSFSQTDEDGIDQKVYVVTAFIFDPKTHRVLSEKVIATRDSFPQVTSKTPYLKKCAFASGIVLRPDGRVDLYSGLGDTHEGRITIDNPFSGYGSISNVKIDD